MRMIGAMFLVASFTLATAHPASADDGVVDEHSSVMPMTIVGFDEEVATANGFEIVKEDGVLRSVPITDEAKAIMAEFEVEPGEFSPSGTVVGDCGTATIDGTKGSGDWVSLRTGYSVYNHVSHRNWSVVVTGFVTGFSYAWPSASTSRTWYAEAGGTAVGPGIGFVPAVAANVVLIDGAICYSGGPSFGFP